MIIELYCLSLVQLVNSSSPNKYYFGSLVSDVKAIPYELVLVSVLLFEG